MNPIAFTVFGFDIRYYSLLILLAVFFAYALITKEARKFKIPGDFVFNLFFWTLIFGIIGARLYYVIFNWEYFSSHINEIWQIWNGGLAIHGGIIVGLITLSIYCRKYNFRIMRMLDMCAGPMILAQAIGRWGNFFNSEAYGVATTLEHLQSLHIPQFVIDGMYINGVYYTPTFFYESMWCIIAFIIIFIFTKRRYTKVGQPTALYLILYGAGRFFIEASRTDSLIFMGFKMAQIVSVIMVVIGVIIFILGAQKSKFEDLYNDNNNVDKVKF